MNAETKRLTSASPSPSFQSPGSRQGNRKQQLSGPLPFQKLGFCSGVSFDHCDFTVVISPSRTCTTDEQRDQQPDDEQHVRWSHSFHVLYPALFRLCTSTIT